MSSRGASELQLLPNVMHFQATAFEHCRSGRISEIVNGRSVAKRDIRVERCRALGSFRNMEPLYRITRIHKLGRCQEQGSANLEARSMPGTIHCQNLSRVLNNQLQMKCVHRNK